MVHSADPAAGGARNRPDVAPLFMGSPRSPLPKELSASPLLDSSPTQPPRHTRTGSLSSTSSTGSWPGASRWIRVSERNAFCSGIEEGPLLSWTLSDFMMHPDRRVLSSFGCTESFPLLRQEACDASLREMYSEAPDGESEASVLVGLGRNSLIRSLFESDSFNNLINRVIDVPVVVRPGARVHHLRPGSAPHELEFVRDSSSSFSCVILLTPVPEDGLCCSYLRRWDGAVETLDFPPGPAGRAFLLHGSQIDHTVLPWADHEASVLCVPIHPADGWLADEELASTQETEAAWSDDELAWGRDTLEGVRALPAGGKPVSMLDACSRDLRHLLAGDAAEGLAPDAQFIMDP
mmetsp:Transcript_45474/g.110711  ORF Transcript_45474/g.110711 Transcript_45474/m.110711 type:complete len:350 (-) Transcript_45474:564-1613(-)